MPIGELARRSGLRPSAIRYYESIGLLPPPGRVAGKRRHDSGAVERLSVIAAGRHAGLTLGEIRELLKADERGSVSQRMQRLARRKLPEVEALIARAEAVRRWLEAAADCTCPSLEECPLFDDESVSSAITAPGARLAR
jgi:MerR family transcriptional regulator, redox-sensitive transcriptional activator SoxR